jgi:proteasome lid subunit RPN8/RPN11
MVAVTSVIGLDGLVGEQVYAHVFGSPDREVGGVLVGRSASQRGAPLVTAAIPAVNATEAQSSLTFTQNAWEHVHRTMEADHPHDEIVGWYHSHPGFGVYLSEDDVFIHRNFFSGASQIALVVDPLAGTEGVFGWDGDQLAQWYERPTARPGLGRRPRRRVTAAAPRAEDAPDGPRPESAPVARPAATLARPSSPFADWLDRNLLVLACALLSGVLVGFGLWEGVLR